MSQYYGPNIEVNGHSRRIRARLPIGVFDITCHVDGSVTGTWNPLADAQAKRQPVATCPACGREIDGNCRRQCQACGFKRECGG